MSGGSLIAMAADEIVSRPPRSRAGPALSAPPAPGPLGAFELTRYAPDTRPPEFRGRTVEGHPVSLGELSGRVLLNFWATRCLECRPEMPATAVSALGPRRVHRMAAAVS